MTKTKLTEQEWETFVELADRLGIPVRELLRRGGKFHVLESVGHSLGRAIAQAATERLALAQADRLTEPQACPACGQQSPVIHRERELETGDGPIDLREPVCHCSACRRDFFPSASRTGAQCQEL